MIISSIVFTQDSTSNFWANRCDYQTDGTGKSLGLKIKLVYPCVWVASDGQRPHVVKKFTGRINQSSIIVQTFVVNKLEKIPSKLEVDQMFSKKGLQESCEDLGTFIEGRRIKIDALDCGELSYKSTRKATTGTIFMYCLNYNIIYKDKLITILYSVSSNTEKNTKELFEKYKLILKTLAGNSIVLNQWM